MASQVTLYEFAKDNFKDTSSDLEDSLAEVEKICCGLGSSERSYPLQIHVMLLGMPLRKPNT